MSAPNAICPHCGQRAPIVLRGIEARCTVCNSVRIPFTAKTLNLAGKPSRVGGLAARFAGWSMAVIGTAVALGLGLLGHALLPEGYAFVGYAIGAPIALVTWFFGLALVFGGRHLSKSGDKAARDAKLQTIRALAAHQRGALTASDAAGKLDIRTEDADALLTELAKDPEQNVRLDLDDDGGIHYLFGPGARIDASRYRIATPMEAPDDAQAFEEALSEEALSVEEAAAAEAHNRRR